MDERVQFTGEALRMVCSYFGGDPRKRREIVDCVLSLSSNHEWTVPEFLELVQEAVAQIPQEKLAEAQVELESDDSWGRLTITYRRMETDGEIAERVRDAQEYLRKRTADEREQLARLKAKYGEA